MKQTKRGFVEVPQTTLNALKNMLFTQNEDGVDLSNIINDLTPNAESKDLTAINIALTHKGVRVNVDERPRYEYDWKNRYYRYDYVGYSLILGVVKVRKTLMEVTDNGENVVSTYDHIECYGFDQWEEKETELSAIHAKIAERNK